MDGFLAEPRAWAEVQFGTAQLGDARRTRRLVEVAQQMAQLPGGSLPQLTETWGDTKAAYRLFDCPEVTFDAVCQPHWDLRHHCQPKTYWVISDTTEVDFGKYRRNAGLGPLNHGGGKGFMLHSALLVDAASGALCGVAGALLLTRSVKKSRKKHRRQKAADSEALRWGQRIDQVGKPPSGTQWIHVMDREADNFEVFLHCREQACDWVVRVRTRLRKVFVQESGGEEQPLHQAVDSAEVRGHYDLEVPAQAASAKGPARPARSARMEVRAATVWLPTPRRSSAYIVSFGGQRLRQHVVWAREVDPPAGEEAVEWILYTSLPVATWDEVRLVLKIYEGRWIIEEYHKALKTGTQVKSRQLQTADRLAPLVGLSSVEAVRLVQLKTAARATPERPASEVVPPVYEQVLEACRRKPKKKIEPAGPMTVREFFRRLAMLGGFLGRKSDGEPGWQTLWRGWEKLTLQVRGYLAANPKPNPQRSG